MTPGPGSRARQYAPPSKPRLALPSTWLLSLLATAPCTCLCVEWCARPVCLWSDPPAGSAMGTGRAAHRKRRRAGGNYSSLNIHSTSTVKLASVPDVASAKLRSPVNVSPKLTVTLFGRTRESIAWNARSSPTQNPRMPCLSFRSRLGRAPLPWEWSKRARRAPAVT